MSGARAFLPPTVAAPWPIRAIGRAVDWSVIAIGGLMAVLIFANVCLHAFGRDLAWVTELGELLMVWVTFLGGAAAAQRGVHMTITEFIDKLEPSARRWADAVVQALCAGILALTAFYGWRLVQANWGNELTVLGWPMATQYMGMAVGSSFMLIFVAFDLWRIVRGEARAARYPVETP